MGVMDNVKEFIENITQNKKAIAVIALILIAVIAWFAFFQPLSDQPQEGEVKAILTFQTSEGTILPELTVSYKSGENSWQQAQTNIEGKLAVNVIQNQSLTVRVPETTLEGKTYSAIEQEFQIGIATFEEEIILVEKIALFASARKTIIVQDAYGIVRGKTLRATFACDNQAISPWQVTDEEKDGIISIEPPLNCGNVSVRVQGPDFQDASVRFSENETEKTVSITEKAIPDGTLRINVVDESENLVTDADFQILVYGTRGTRYEKTTEGSGSTEVDVAPGTYNVAVQDPQNKYGSANQNNVVVSSTEVNEIDITVSKTLKGTIKVKVIDKDNRQAIPSAIVILKNASDNSIKSEKTTGTDGKVEFPVTEERAYIVVAKKEGVVNTGFFPKETQTSNANADIVMELEKITQRNSGKVIVHVVDEDNVPVRNARVMMLKKDSGNILDITNANAGFNARFTDVNGNAEFVLGNLEYEIYPFAVKLKASGGTPEIAKKIQVENATEFTVQMTIGKAHVLIEARNFEDNQLIADGLARYEVFTEEGQKVFGGERPLASGSETVDMKADARVYVIIKHPSFMSVQSRVIELMPDQTFTVTGTLRQPFYGLYDSQAPEVILEGVYDELGQTLADKMEAGKNYEVRLRVTFPTDVELSEGGIHFRVGDSDRMENDPLYIRFEKINAAGYLHAPMGTTYRQNSGWNNETLTFGRGKWVNLVWANPEPIEYSVGIGIHVKEDARDQPLTIYYRAWDKKETGGFARDPQGIALFADKAEDQGSLYAPAYSIQFMEGETQACGRISTGTESAENAPEFCWSNEEVVGRIPGEGTQGLLEKSAQYTVSNYSTYNVTFALRNNNRHAYNNVKLQVENITGRGTTQQDDTLEIKEFKLEKDAEGKPQTGGVSERFKSELQGLNNFTFNKQILGSVQFKTLRQNNSTGLRFRLVGTLSGQTGEQVIFEKVIPFKVNSDREISIEIVNPENKLIPAFSPMTLQVEVSETRISPNGQTQTGLLDGATVSVWEKREGVIELAKVPNTEMLSGPEGNERHLTGQAIIELPSEGFPGTTQLTVKAIKEGYAEVEEALEIEDELVTFAPIKLEFALKSRELEPKIEFLKVNNRTVLPLELISVELIPPSGGFGGLVNEEAMRNFIQQQLTSDTIIAGQTPKELSISAQVAGNAHMAMQHSVNFKTDSGNGAQLDVRVLLNGQHEFPYTVPVDIGIQLSTLPDNADECLVLAGANYPDWTKTIMGLNTKESADFELSNHCIMGAGTPINLDGLEARLTESIPGIVEIQVREPGTAQVVTEKLRSNTWTPLLPRVLQTQDTPYTVVISFTPTDASALQGDVVFGIELQAKVKSDNQLIELTSPLHVNAKMTVVNIEQCVQVTDGTNPINKITLAETLTGTEATTGTASFTEPEQEITIDTSLCGNTPIIVNFCKDDPGCTGGTGGNSAEGIAGEPNAYILVNGQRETQITIDPTQPTQQVTVTSGTIPGIYGLTIHARTPPTQPQEVTTVDIIVKESSEQFLKLDRYNVELLEDGRRDSLKIFNTQLMEKVNVKLSSCARGEADQAGLLDADVVGTDLFSDWTQGGLSIAGGVGGALLGAYLGATIAATVGIAATTTAVTATTTTGTTTITTVAAGSSVVPVIGAIVVAVAIVVIIVILTDCDDDPESSDAVAMTIPDLVFTLHELNLTESPLSEYKDNVSIQANDVEGKPGLETTLETRVLDLVRNDNGNTMPAPEVYDILTLKGPKHINVPAQEGSSEKTLTIKDDDMDDLTDWGRQVFGRYVGKYDRGVPFNLIRTEDDETLETIEDSEQKFHIRIRTRPDLPPAQAIEPEFACEGGSKGVTGNARTLPKIKLNWDWSANPQDQWNICDVDKVKLDASGTPILDELGQPMSDYIYCDATQFSMEVTHRLELLQEFLALNTNMECPSNPLNQAFQSQSGEVTETRSEREVNDGQVGLSKIESVQLPGASMKLKLRVENKGNAPATKTVELIARGPEYSRNLQQSVTVPANAVGDTAQVIEFTLDGLRNEKIYSVSARVQPNAQGTPASPVQPDSGQVGLAFFYTTEGVQASDCWLPASTENAHGFPIIRYYIDNTLPELGPLVKHQTVYPGNWPEEWKTPAFIDKLIRFRVALIKDNYTPDFRQDFVRTMSRRSVQVPPYFKTEGQIGIADYFNDMEKMNIVKKYTRNDYSLETPGQYNVEFNLKFTDRYWSLYNAQGNLNSNIEVTMYKVEDPFPSSVFYWIPFNGDVGYEVEASGRTGYGVNYSASEEGQPVNLTQTLKTQSLTGSTSVPTVSTSIDTTLDYLNANSNTRGKILSIKSDGVSGYNLIFSPSKAIPVIAQVHQEEATEQPFTAEYQIFDSSDNPVTTAGNATYWTGVGQCRDFSGVSVQQVIRNVPDMKNSEQQSYQMYEWPSANMAGNVYLKTIFYRPANTSEYYVRSKSDSLKFATGLNPVQTEENMELNGVIVGGQEGGIDQITTLAQAMDEVKNGNICLSDNGMEASFWWNPKLVNENAAYNVSEFEQGIHMQSDASKCIAG